MDLAEKDGRHFNQINAFSANMVERSAASTGSEVRMRAALASSVCTHTCWRGRAAARALAVGTWTVQTRNKIAVGPGFGSQGLRFKSPSHRCIPRPRPAAPQDAPMCWICLDYSGQLIFPCKCPR